MPNEERLAAAEQAEETTGGKFKKWKKPKKEKAEKPPKEKKPKKEKAEKLSREDQLSEEERPAKEKKPKKEKAAKPKKAKPKAAKPKPKKKPPKDTAAAKRPAKEPGGFPFGLVLVGLVVVVLGAVGASIYLDLFQVRTDIIDALSSLDPQNHTYADTLRQRDEALVLAEIDLAERQAELQQLGDKLTADETRLQKRETALNEREKKLTQQEIENTPVYRGDLSDEKLAELKNLGKIYSGMSAESAASILPKLYGAADMASILFYMDKTAAAAVMELLNPELSAQITTEMLRE